MQSVNALPANQTLIVLDSQFKKTNESVYDFTGTFGGSGLYCKEFYYSKLYWNQPLFAHNDKNNELIFSINNDDSVKYVVYATPFLMYNLFDGNPKGTSLLPPSDFSYAKNMELAFNGDVRYLVNNANLIFGDGKIRNGNVDSGEIISFEFRYNPSRGFCVYPVQDNDEIVYTIKFWSCSYISKAHFTHGFGIINPSISTTEFVPKSFYSLQIWSDTTPLLLPYRFIMIRSNLLTKDRRLMSFQNGGNSSSVSSEVAIFACDFERTGVYSVLSQGEDASVISLRSEFTPQDFDITILGESNAPLRCDDPISAFLQDATIDITAKTSFLSGPLRNRGNYLTTNFLVFGKSWEIGLNSIPTAIATSIYYQENLTRTSSVRVITIGLDDDTDISTLFLPGVLNETRLILLSTMIESAFLINGIPPVVRSNLSLTFFNTPSPGMTSYASGFYWNYNLYSTFRICPDLFMSFKRLPGTEWDDIRSNLIIAMFDVGAENDNSILSSDFSYNNNGIPFMPIALFPIGTFIFPGTTETMAQYFSDTQGLIGIWNKSFNASANYKNLSSIPVCFGVLATNSPTGINSPFQIHVWGPPISGVTQPFLGFAGEYLQHPNVYNIPGSEGFDYGDPQADGLCEPLVHELVAVLEKN